MSSSKFLPNVVVPSLMRASVVIQLRVHTSHNCHFLIRTTSDTIIEDSDGLSFGPYPGTVSGEVEPGAQVSFEPFICISLT